MSPNYLNPGNVIMNGNFVSSMQEIMPKISKDELLIGVAHERGGKINYAVILENDSIYKEYWRQQVEFRELFAIELYLLPKKKLDLCREEQNPAVKRIEALVNID